MIMCLAWVPVSNLEMCLAQIHLAIVVSDVKSIYNLKENEDFMFHLKDIEYKRSAKKKELEGIISQLKE